MRVSVDDVKATALMARLHLAEEEVQALQANIEKILTYADQLQEVNVAGVGSMTHTVAMACPYRADEVLGHLSIEDALRNAPQKEASFFAVPTILAKEEG